MDCLLLLPLFPPDDGVCVRCAVVRPGEAALPGVGTPLTGVVEFGFSSPCDAFRGGGCNDFVRELLAAVESRGASPTVAELGARVSRRPPLLIEAARDNEPVEGCASRTARLSSNPWLIRPGPIDFLGTRAAAAAVVFVASPDGRALCLRARAERGALGGGMAVESAVGCPGGRRALLNRRAREELRETFPGSLCPRPTPTLPLTPRSAAMAVPRPFPSGSGGFVGDPNLPLVLVPGCGKLSRSGSYAVILA